MKNKRSKRRKAWKQREYLNQYATKVINQDYLWASSTWGGTRCGDCGIPTEPRWHLDKKFCFWFVDRNQGIGRVHGIEPVCDRVGVKCLGEDTDWQNKV